MNTNLKDVFIFLLDRDIERLKEEINGYADEEKLWQTAGAIKNSGGNLCLHLIGSLNHFIGAVLGNTGYVRNYDQEFVLKNISKNQLLSELDQTRHIVKNTLLTLNDEDLNNTYPVKWQQQDVPVYWFISHLLTHVNYHLGQINYHRRLIHSS